MNPRQYINKYLSCVSAQVRVLNTPELRHRCVWMGITHIIHVAAITVAVFHLATTYEANDLVLMLWEGPTLALRGYTATLDRAAFIISFMVWPAWTYVFQSVRTRGEIACALCLFCMLQYLIPVWCIAQDVRHVGHFVTCLSTQARFTIPQTVLFVTCQCGYLGYMLLKYVKVPEVACVKKPHKWMK